MTASGVTAVSWPVESRWRSANTSPQTRIVDVQAVLLEGHDEILALHRMLMDSKSDDLDSEYAGSPFVAAIQHRLADALEAADPGDSWTVWRAADQHPHRVDAVRAHLSQQGEWWLASDEDRRSAYVRDLLAPLRPSRELLAELTAVQTAQASGREQQTIEPFPTS